MHMGQAMNPDTMTMIQKTIKDPLAAGELGVLMAGAGVGKTACLTHIALGQLLKGESVLHVCIAETPDKAKVWYHELLKNVVAPGDLKGIEHSIEPLRFILAYLHQTFNPAKLEQSILDLREQAKFQPSMLILDGLDFDRISRSTIEGIAAVAQRNSVSVWMSARTHRHISQANEHGIPYPCNSIDDLFSAVLLLDAIPEAIQVKVLKHRERYMPEHAEVHLNPQTFLLQN